MHLTRLTVKAHGIEHDLQPTEPVVLVTGANATGKSTLLHTIALLLHNQRPSDHEMGFDVEGEWSDGLTVARSVADGKQLALCSAVAASSKVGVVNGAIAASLGRASAFDVEAFLALSGPKRTRALEDAQVLTLEDDGDIDLPDELEELLGKDAARGRRTKQAYLEHLVAAAEQAWRDCNADVRKVTAAAEQANKTATATDLPAGTVAQWQERVTETMKHIAELEARAKMADDHKKARQSAEAEVKSLREAIARLDALDGQTRALEEERQKLTAEITEHEEVFKARSQSAAKLNKQRETHVAAYRAARERHTAAVKAASESEGATEALKAVRPLLAALQAIPRDVEHHPLVIKALELADALQLKPEDAAQDVAAAKAEMDTIEMQGQAARRKAERATADASMAKQRMVAKQSRSNSALGELDKLYAQAAKAPELRRAHEDRLQEVQERLADTAAPNVDNELQAARELLRDQQAKLYKLQDATSMQAEASKATARVAQITNKRDRVRKLRDTLRKMQGDFLQSATEGLVSIASRVTQAVMGYRLSLDLAKGCRILLGERVTGERALEYRSHSEQLIGAVALHVAITARMTGWRCVVLDNAEAIEPERLSRLLVVLRELCAEGVLHNAFVASVNTLAPPPGVQYLHLRRT